MPPAASRHDPKHDRPGHDRESEAAGDELALLGLVGAGGATAPRRRLLDRHGSAAAAIAAGPRAWRAAGLSEQQIERLGAPAPAETARSLDWLRVPGHHLVGWRHPDYPPLLRRAPNPPLALFVAGEPALLWHPAVAVVGSRSPTPAGRDNAADFARALARSGLAVVSGLAAGIDTAAHRATLDAGGLTVAVLGTGPDLAYPRSNAELLARIAAAGAVVSEHPPGQQARPEHFPSRNRILAGLSLGTVVIEAAERSGALITARLASESGREVFAVPGSIHNPVARGCHRLIRDGAGLVENAGEVAAALVPLAAELADGLRRRLGVPTTTGHAGDDPAAPEDGPGHASVTRGDHDARERPAGASPRPEFADPDYQRLWNALGYDPTGMDRLVERTGLTIAELSSMLLAMELEGRVAALHGRYFRNR